MRKKRILWLSNFSLANSGFGKCTREFLFRLYKTGKYEICELSAGVSDLEPTIAKLPWKIIGVLPKNHHEAAIFNAASEEQKRAFSYGLFRFDEAVSSFKPDVAICCEDCWAWASWLKNSKYWGKFIPFQFSPLDAEPLSQDFADFLKDIPHIYTYSRWSQKIGFDAGLPQTKVLRLGVDTSIFKPLPKSYVAQLRASNGIKPTDFVVLMVARNQIRKKFDALFESLLDMKRFYPELYKNIKILPYSNFTDGAGIFFPNFWKSRKLDVSKFLIPYYCKACQKYHIAANYVGEEAKCPHCGAEKTCCTPSVVTGLNEHQLNEVYNIADTVTLPTSNEGQGQCVTEGLAVGKICSTTDYSTSKEMAEDAGMSSFLIPCTYYTEYGTFFKKANVSAYEIAKVLNKIYGLKSQRRMELEAKGRNYAETELNYDVLTVKLEEALDVIEPLKDVVWEIKNVEKNPNPNGQLPPTTNDIEWLVSLYKNILDTDILEETNGEPLKSNGIQYWLQEISKKVRTKEEIEKFFRQTAVEDLKKKPVDLASLLNPNDGKRLLVCIPQSAGDNFICTSIVASIKEKYPEHAIYISCKPEFAEIWVNNPSVRGILPFDDVMLTYNWGTDRFEKGIFDIVFTPTQMTQCNTGPNWSQLGRTQSFLLK